VKTFFVELRGFEPLTPSMPWSFVLSVGVSDCGWILELLEHGDFDVCLEF
jgi:hypothetical protein